MALSGIGGVLAQPNLRLFFGGSLTSWTGLWVQKVATDWLAWELTHSALWVGVMAFCNLAPSVIVSPFAGAAADRMDRMGLTMTTQLVTATHAATLAVLTITGLIRIEAMAGLEILLGTAQAFAQPARQSMVPGLVTRAQLPGAVALNSLCFNLARSIGPAIGGTIVAVAGVVPAMLVNCAAYLFATVSLARVRIAPEARRGHAPTGSVLREALEGIAYTARHAGLGPLFLFAAVVGVLVRPVPEMLPPFVAQLFHQGPAGLAALSSAIGLAALAAGLALAVRGRLSGLTAFALGGAMAMATGAAGFVATGHFHVGLACAAIMGAATTIHGVAISTLMQSATSGHMIGRVLSLWGMIGRAGPALGALLYGALAGPFGLQAPVLAGAFLALLVCLATLRRLPRMARALERGD